MSAPSKFEEVKTILNDGPSAETRSAQRARIVSKARKARSRWPVLVVAAAAVLAVVLMTTRPADLAMNEKGERIAVGSRVSTSSSWRFDEKSAVEISDNTRILVRKLDREEVVLDLEEGRVDLNVTHGTGRTWQVQAADVTIHVVGTRLRVERHGAQVDVSVTEGVVEVTGPLSQRHRVIEGEMWTNRVVAEVQAPAIEPQQIGDLTEPVIAPVPRPRVVVASWKAAFERGDYAATFDLAEKSGVLSRPEALTAVDLISLATAARLTSHLGAAAQLLRSSIEKAGAHQAEAAFMLGRLELQRNHAKEAANEFERAVKFTPSGPIAEEAWSRLFDTLTRLNETERLHRNAERYLQIFPSGSSSARAKTVLGQ